MSLNKDHPIDFIIDPTLSTFSSEELDEYSRGDWVSRDPLLLRSASSEHAFIWRWNEWSGTKDQDFSDYLREIGLRGGITVPLRQKPGKIGAMNLLSESDAPLHQDNLFAAQTLAQLAMARASALSSHEAIAALDLHRLKRLSKQQEEILRWIANGKTNREIAVILGSKHRTVDYHVQEILGKLEVSTRTQAATIYAAAQD